MAPSIPVVNSAADLMETLENLRSQHSESDLTNSGSSSVSSSTSASDDDGGQGEGHAQSKGSTQSEQQEGGGESSRHKTNLDLGRVADNGGGELDADAAAVDKDSIGVVGPRRSGQGVRKSHDQMSSSGPDNSPLEPLERLCLSLAAETFDDDDDGDAADDEDDEPNFPPPPPPIVNLPEEMFQSYESDLPLPDLNSGHAASAAGACSAAMMMDLQGWPGVLGKDGRGPPHPQALTAPRVSPSSSESDDSDRHKAQSARAAAAGECSSSAGLARFAPRQATPRLSLDPLAQLEFGDLVGDMHCTTSESESDFDAEEANTSIQRRLSTSIVGSAVASASVASSLERSLQHGLPLYSENPSHRAQLQQHQHHQQQQLQKHQHHHQRSHNLHQHQQQHPSRRLPPESTTASQDGALHVVQKAQPVSADTSASQSAQREANPPKCYPKPARAKAKPPVPLPAHVTSQQAQPSDQVSSQQQAGHVIPQAPPPPVHPRPGVQLRQPQMGKGKQFDRLQRHKTTSTSSSSSSSSTSSSSSSSSSSSTGRLDGRRYPPAPPPPAPPQS
ncbi:hypothetical protein EGW08_020218 [Elysia chlorotica]|uniref:Uncharacterized protein n=1 Tax=Elysia chlorotica TaxID=188477 RepID=A0A3S0ZP67_ELYCH|nr:hypothetical protein EGW08_020218 [Elysia chlorotica]